MTHTAAHHRNLDSRAALATGETPGHALMRSRHRLKDLRKIADRRPRVLLLDAEIRISERTGRQWYSAWLGRCRLGWAPVPLARPALLWWRCSSTSRAGDP
jgi:hypothetical protein